MKTCNNRTPTNDQLYFTTATAFCSLLRRNGINVPKAAQDALRMFCGDNGCRPKDDPNCPADRVSDPDRWFWEELPRRGRSQFERILRDHQRKVSMILLQKAYPDDPFAPSYLLHQTVKYDDVHDSSLALFTMDELLDCTCAYSGYETRSYRIRKGRFKHDPNGHLAPRFGFIQFQRAGNKQHPTQLQFNLQAGYFNKLPSRV